MRPRRVKRIRINPTTRLKADARANARLLTELYQPYQEAPEKRPTQQAKRSGFLKRLSPTWFLIKSRAVGPAIKDLLFGGSSLRSNLEVAKFNMEQAPDAFYHPASRRTFYSPPSGKYYNARRYYRRMMLHELTHALGFSKNHLVTAGAMDSYTNKLKEARTIKEVRHSKLLSNPGAIKAIDSFFRGWKRFLPTEYTPVGGFAPIDLGTKLGYFAGDLEVERGRPGLGGIFIREVSNGTPFMKALEKARKGDYDLEAELWLYRTAKEHPMIVAHHFGKNWDIPREKAA